MTSEPMAITVGAAAVALSVSARTVRRLLAGGELAPVRIGRAVRVNAASLRAFVERASPPPVPVPAPENIAVRATLVRGAMARETKPCQDDRNETKTDFSRGQTHRSGGRASRMDAGAQLAALLEFDASKTRRERKPTP